jgi:FkbM family methyltransferase
MSKLIIPQHNLGNYIIPKSVHGGLAVDIGSNVGGFLKRAYNIFSEIHFYEPIIECFRICEEFSNTYGHIHGHNVAVSDTRGTANIIMHKNNLAGSSAIDALAADIIDLEHGEHNIINEVNCITLEDIYQQINYRDIDYCKSDCEISEYNIFMNQNLSRIKYLAIELHWQMGEERYENLIQYISQTHRCIHGNLMYPGKFDNREVLFERI